MEVQIVEISCRRLGSCLVNLSPDVVDRLCPGRLGSPRDVIIAISSGKRSPSLRSADEIILSWSGVYAAAGESVDGTGRLEMDVNYSECLGIRDGQKFYASAMGVPPEPARLVLAEALDDSDWKLVQRYRDDIEAMFLNQACVVGTGQPFALWLPDNAVARLIPVCTDPAGTFVTVREGLELVVRGPCRITDPGAIVELNFERSTPFESYRSIPFSFVFKSERCSAFSPALISSPAALHLPRRCPWVVRITALSDARDPPGPIGICLLLGASPSAPEMHVVLPDQLFSANGIEPLSLVTMSSPSKPPVNPRAAVLQASGSKGEPGPELLKHAIGKALEEQGHVVFTHGVVLDTDAGSLTLKSASKSHRCNPDYAVIGKDTLDRVTIEPAGSALMPATPRSILTPATPGKHPGVDGVVDRMCKMVVHGEDLATSSSGVRFIVLRGEPGSGKTLVVNMLEDALSKNPPYVYVSRLSCRSIRYFPVKNIRKSLTQSILKCSMNHPALLLMDDLDALIPDHAEAQSPISSDTAETAKVREICDAFIVEVSKVASSVNVVLLATSRAADGICSHVREALFPSIIELSEMESEHRMELLESFAAASGPNIRVTKDVIRNVCEATPGTLPGDLYKLMQRSVGRAINRAIKSGARACDVSMEDFAAELNSRFLAGFRPADKGGKWNTIGGLSAAKNIIAETIEWPVWFPELMKKSPIRRQSNILIYGYPGCGKTLLGSSISQKCGLVYISVKGPEVMDKYVGESERAIRDIFRRAVASRPCVLFFDEFDVIGARRGSDNTGVTDRVVNQLLTEIDGIKGQSEDLYILAATTRPDAVDPALIRPGRFDKMVFCDLPAKEERLEIFLKLSSGMLLGPDVNFNHLVDSTEDYSGADIEALLLTAHIEALKEGLGPLGLAFPSEDAECNARNAPASRLDSDAASVPREKVQELLESAVLGRTKIQKASPGNVRVVVHQRHLSRSLGLVRRSLSNADISHLGAIYKTFQAGFQTRNANSTLPVST